MTIMFGSLKGVRTYCLIVNVLPDQLNCLFTTVLLLVCRLAYSAYGVLFMCLHPYDTW